MVSEELKVLLENELPGCYSQVDIKGSHFNILVVSGLFDGKRAIQRQQMIYACLLYTSQSPRDVEESRMPYSA